MPESKTSSRGKSGVIRKEKEKAREKEHKINASKDPRLTDGQQMPTGQLPEIKAVKYNPNKRL